MYEVDGNEDPPLSIAAVNRDTSIIRSLIEHEAYINAQGGVYGNILRAASSQGHSKAD